MMYRPNPYLKNINFWGLLICNLAIANKILNVIFKTLDNNHIEIDSKFIFVVPTLIFVILTHVFLFKKINFETKSNWKLLLYSFLFYYLIAFPSRFIFYYHFIDTDGVLVFLLNLLLKIFMVNFPNFIFFIGVNLLWLIKEKNKNKSTSILNNTNFGIIIITNLVLFYFFLDNGILKYYSRFTIFSFLSIITLWYLFKKINFAKTANWRLALYSLLSSIVIISLAIKIRLIILYGFQDYKNIDTVHNFVDGIKFLLVVLVDIVTTFILGIYRGIWIIPLISIVCFIGLYREKNKDKSIRQLLKLKNKTN